MTQIDQIKNFNRLASLCGASEALRAALQSGVVEALQGPPQTAQELSQICQIAEPRLLLLLDVLVSLGAVEQYGDDYALSTAMRLASQHPQAWHGEHWQRLPEFLRSQDESAETDGGDDALHAYRGESLSLQWTLTAAAMELAEQLQIGTERKEPRILDLGAGSAMWSCALAYRDPHSRVTAVDVPEAIEAAQRTADEIGIGDRIELLPGDYRTIELPESAFDLALAVGLLELEPLEQARPWLKRVCQSLDGGGELVIVGRFPGQPVGDLHRALASLELAVRVPQAAPHAVGDVLDELDRAGFEAKSPIMLEAPPYSLGAVIAKRA